MAEITKKYLTFEVASQLYAIDIAEVTEILSNGAGCIRIPEFPDYAKGIIHLRGNVVSIIDLAKRFGCNVPLYNDFCVIVSRLDDTAHSLVGFAADKVNAVDDFEVSKILEPPSVVSGADYLKGIIKKNSRIILILDPALLVGDKMRTAIGKMNEDSENE